MAGGGEELKLIGMWASSFALRARLALSLKGLSYEYMEEDLSNKSDLLLGSNPVHKKVPVLIHNGKPVCESQIIVQYIDEAFAGTGLPLLPADPYERAIARFWGAFVDDKLVASWVQASWGKTDEEKAEGVRQMLAAVEALEGALEESSKGRPFFGGDSAGYVDVVLGSLLADARAAEARRGFRLLDASRTPLLASWARRFADLEAVRAVMPDVDRMVDYANMGAAKAAAAAAN
ncbi:hypothetical protein ACP4OV_025612 [Aristida adscensionis]